MEPTAHPIEKAQRPGDWIFDLLFVAVLLIGAYFRFSGLDWDEGTYLHPDERFLAMVESSIEPVGSFSEYWDTQVSSLNPNNRGHGFFVYGTLPIFLVRYAMEWAGQVGYGDVARIGRPLAGLFDLLTIFVLYLTAARLYDRRVGFLAAAFSSFAVLQIQLSHFFTVDIFANFFIWLAIYFGARIARASGSAQPAAANAGPLDQALDILHRAIAHPVAAPALVFGLFAGMAVASKASAYPVVFLLPLAAWIHVAQHNKQDRPPHLPVVVVLLVFSGALAALAFRIFQPYAFSGPGFFGILPNPLWVESIGRLRELVQPASGFPPSVQWFDRPLWFSGYHMTFWGLGLPLGLAAWGGLLWMGWRIVKGEWRVHALVWVWVAGHFLWQSTVPNPTMRYQLPIYPGMALMAAWGLVSLLDWARRRSGAAVQSAAAALVIVTLLFTFVYAAAFSGIYRQEVTRIAASRWMYANLPAALNVRVGAGSATVSQPLPFPNGYAIRPGEPFTTSFTAAQTGPLVEIYTPHLVTTAAATGGSALYLGLETGGGDRLATAFVNADFGVDAALGLAGYEFTFNQPVALTALETYSLTIELIGDAGSVEVCGTLLLDLITESGQAQVEVAPPADCRLSSAQPYRASFTTEADGLLPGVSLPLLENYIPFALEQKIGLSVLAGPDGPLLGASEVFVEGNQDGVTFSFASGVELVAGQTYTIRVEVNEGNPISFHGTVLAQETSWDDPLPMRVDGLDGFGGIYKGDNNLELYWDDNPEKVQRMVSMLDAVDVIPISSSRQWGSLTRLPERWPLVDAYYRSLMGCPPERTIEWCFNVAEPGMFEGSLGFELVEVFVSNPTLGPFTVNDQFSEEAFTVYDHPKVFIFVKTEDYDPQFVRALLGNIPLPGTAPPVGDAGEPAKSLLLSPERAEAQRSAGTWSDLFDTGSLINRFQPLAVLAWYLAATLLGLAVFPLLRRAMPGLDDGGYPLMRTAGLLLFSYIAWMLGSAGLPVTRTLLTAIAGLMLAAGLWAAIRQRAELLREWRRRKTYYLAIEALALALFLFFLFIRIANPDLWHPWKGGEKPMDFAYFNAVLKSTVFPPYDPWFAGGYINYYYYGFVFVGMLVKWLGIVPAVAYNLIIPTLFMMVGLGAFSIGWNLVRSAAGRVRQRSLDMVHLEPAQPAAAMPILRRSWSSTRLAYLAGLASTLGVAILGNLGTVRMIFQGYQRVAAPAGVILDESFFLARWVWTVRGFFDVLSSKAQLPYALADWYWNPSRVIPAPGDVEPITEFPFFSYLYADLHAHLLALPITLLALAWALSVVQARGRWGSLAAGLLGFLAGGLAIGALRPTNTWDYPTYLALGMLALGYAFWRNGGAALAERLPAVPGWAVRLAAAISASVLLLALSWFLFQPFTESYALGYTDVSTWQGAHTSLSAYLTHWGPFLFLIVTWMLWETREWLASVPASAGLRFLRRYRDFLLAGLLGLVAAAALLAALDVSLSFFVLPLAAWAGVLLFRPGLADARRAVLFLTGTGLFLTLMVETIVLAGDIGRMNTVFKFYFQVWVLLGVSAAAAFAWLLPELDRWHAVWSRPWRVILGLLVFCTALYPLLGGFAKMKDRMSESAPITLDGIAYMPYGSYFDQDRELLFVEDFRAIRWLQENIQGTPVIVEGQVVEYRWGARYSINTGLPTVLGWNWHQRQQRTGHDLDVWDRENRVREFYSTTNVNIANRFLDDFSVEYIIVGQMERAYYPAAGLEKFELFDGRYWQEVYRDGQTVIYQVLEE